MAIDQAMSQQQAPFVQFQSGGGSPLIMQTCGDSQSQKVSIDHRQTYFL